MVVVVMRLLSLLSAQQRYEENKQEEAEKRNLRPRLRLHLLLFIALRKQHQGPPTGNMLDDGDDDDDNNNSKLKDDELERLTEPARSSRTVASSASKATLEGTSTGGLEYR